jgi:hypothetical protein
MKTRQESRQMFDKIYVGIVWLNTLRERLELRVAWQQQGLNGSGGRKPNRGKV